MTFPFSTRYACWKGLDIEACFPCRVEPHVSGGWLRCTCPPKRAAMRRRWKARRRFMARRSVIVSESAYPTRFADEGYPLCQFLTWGSASTLAAPSSSSMEVSRSSSCPSWTSSSPSSMAARDSEASSCTSTHSKALGQGGEGFFCLSKALLQRRCIFWQGKDHYWARGTL